MKLTQELLHVIITIIENYALVRSCKPCGSLNVIDFSHVIKPFMPTLASLDLETTKTLLFIGFIGGIRDDDDFRSLYEQCDCDTNTLYTFITTTIQSMNPRNSANASYARATLFSRANIDFELQKGLERLGINWE